MLENVGVHVRKPEDRQGGGGGGQDEPWGLVPSGGRDHRGGEDRAVDRAAGARDEHAQPARPRRSCRRAPPIRQGYAAGPWVSLGGAGMRRSSCLVVPCYRREVRPVPVPVVPLPALRR